MTILEALQKTTEEIKAWVESKFLNKNDVSEQISNAINKINYPVDSVNGQTGNIRLTAIDVGALPSDTDIPDTLSDLTDDSMHRTVTDEEKRSWNAKSEFSGDYNDLINLPTIDNFGVYVQSQEPTEAVAGDIWIDTANDPSYIPSTLPDITDGDNGKVIMVVNGRFQLVSLNLSIDDNGVVSI